MNASTRTRSCREEAPIGTRQQAAAWLACLGGATWIAGVAMASDPKGISLPGPAKDGQLSVERAIQARRTIRSFEGKALSLHQLSQLLWAGQGITGEKGLHLRAAPSGGALYPLDLYAIVGEGKVQGLPPGVFRYLPESHSLLEISPGDKRRSLAAASLGQMWMAEAPVVFAITAEYRRITQKYGERGVRYAQIEAGHAGQNIFLQAEALGLGVGIVGAFEDSRVSALLSCRPGQEPLLLLPVGHRR